MNPQLGPTVLGKTEILSYLGEVADELAARQLVCRLVVVGGSYLALHDLREATADVDSLTELTDGLRDVVRVVGERHGLRPDWLNDSAMTFAPAGLKVEDCELLYEHTNLLVLGPSPDQVFLMKLLASRAPDHDDMTVLWPRCGFSDAHAAVDAYYSAYPFEERDPYLVDYVQQIADQSTRQ
ncbi:DUF6036 family nucleotidyltransferase [Kribbella speibonae]|uniref:DUF6036 domain-containing protein n=1 Tax=Kribbella speibonae TaxID=1572660 RepID=A0A4R0J5C4_9ACTN|nr:DUF6036 family nucleotidyltransferase [Kribbella speibonae]TCC41813.1 hypothetical protein E0H92_09265 [Kribbella speibonae]